jgi:phage recombination protein Bet
MTPMPLLLETAPIVTSDQMALIKTTIAKDATDQELQLFFYDCKRQGVHPLDRLIHFTKRGGKYTPITSIDFMCQRVAQTGECAGIDDAVYTGEAKTADFTASVTVYRPSRPARAFTATARWLVQAGTNDFMWRKMPYVMLGKCAEALALEGFPQQLAGLYTTEELDQARDPRLAAGAADADQ